MTCSWYIPFGADRQYPLQGAGLTPRDSTDTAQLEQYARPEPMDSAISFVWVEIGPVEEPNYRLQTATSAHAHKIFHDALASTIWLYGVEVSTVDSDSLKLELPPTPVRVRVRPERMMSAFIVLWNKTTREPHDEVLMDKTERKWSGRNVDLNWTNLRALLRGDDMRMRYNSDEDLLNLNFDQLVDPLDDSFWRLDIAQDRTYVDGTLGTVPCTYKDR
ncbi:hypothetical protein CONLIGDRAFT_641894 [Coniochaeta ligniaria NRRL 30616]|uniref:Uncharacterized protein n=1 Tax=Coniochaeta ligniaria NRRL 30616 TaxID=1408157 RepID=A0A1J7IYA1_9PEZI|nr:hypothetical protein CONLIGDRAFT_641894 [Coniochaeta ligniaria NRRL 30616]